MASRVKSKLSVDNKGLGQFAKNLSQPYYAKIGVLASGKANEVHNGTTATNAEIGVWNEFGTDKIPPRSWLRMPIEFKMPEIKKFIASKPMQKLILAGRIQDALALLAVKGEQIIQDAFASAGFGKWTPNAPSTIAKKGSSSPLIDKGQFRAAVTSEVVKK